MRFITSIFMLLTAVSGVISAYFVGHGLVIGESWPWLTAASLLAASVVFGFIYLRLAKRDPRPAPHGQGHADTSAHRKPHGHEHS